MNKAAEVLIQAMTELDQESQKLLVAARRLEQEAGNLLAVVKRCFPQPELQPAMEERPPTEQLH